MTVAQRVDADAGGEIQIALALGVGGGHAVALGQHDLAAGVGVQNVLVIAFDDFFGLHGIPSLMVAAAVEHGTGAAVTEHFQQDGMGHTAIDDNGLVYALIDGVGHTFDLRQHAAGNDTGRLVALDLGDFDLWDRVDSSFLS